MIDTNLPEAWQGSYGTLNTRRALAEINARLCALEGNQAQTTPQSLRSHPNSAVMIERTDDGGWVGKHVLVHYTTPLARDAALAWLRGHSIAFVAPTAAGAVLDAL